MNIPIDDDEEYEKARLMRLSKDEIIEEFLQMKVRISSLSQNLLTSTMPPSPPLPPLLNSRQLKASASSNSTRRNDNASEENNDSTPVNKESCAEPGDGGW